MSEKETSWAEATFGSAKLCEACSAIGFNDNLPNACERRNTSGLSVLDFKGSAFSREYPVYYTHEDRLPQLPYLMHSAELGCGFCGALRDATLKLKLSRPGNITYCLKYFWNCFSKHEAGLHTLRADLSIEYDVFDCGLQDGTSSFTKIGAQISNPTYSLIFGVESGQGNCSDWLRLFPSSYRHTLCEENVSWLKKELRNCLSECGPRQTPGFVPTRLLDLEARSLLDEIQIKETSCMDSEFPIQYAALSYCWGPKEDAEQQLKTTARNLDEHLREVTLTSAPKVIQDAVTTTRALSIRYLWIDALCIIQDDVKDWTKESQRMGLIFANAHVTFCILASSSCQDNFLERAIPVEIAFQSSINHDIRGTYKLRYQHLRSEDPMSKTPVPLCMDRDSGIWHDRAWTFQEEHFAARRILFGPSCVHFSCPAKLVTEPGTQFQGLNYCFKDRIWDYQQNLTSMEDLYNHWNSNMGSYARRRLTFPNDRFPAISGLAKAMFEVTGDEYIAGLWSNDLLRGLLFRCSSSSTCQEQHVHSFISNDYISPSWSWGRHYSILYEPEFTALEEPKEKWMRRSAYYHVRFRSECQTLKAWSFPRDPDANPYGQITSAGLCVNGKLANTDSQWVGCLCTRAWTAKFGFQNFATCELDSPVQDNEISTLKDVSLLLLASSFGVGPQTPHDGWIMNGGSTHGVLFCIL